MESIKNLLKDKDGKTQWILFLLTWLFAGIYATNTGFDRSYDFLNYHMYNPWAYLTGRVGIDFMPADVESYFNPFLDIPDFLFAKYLNDFPYVYLFLQTIFYAIFVLMVYKIAKLFFKGSLLKLWSSFIVGVTSAIVIFNLCSSSHDMIMADFVLVAMWLIFKYTKKPKKRYFFGSAILLGVSVTLRLTNGIFVLPLAIAMYLSFREQNLGFKKTLLWFCVVGLSFLLTDGHWLYTIYSLYQNPVFPYFNSIFQSDIVVRDDILSIDFNQLIPKSLMEVFFYPFYMTSNYPNIGFERKFTDYRFASMYLVIIITFVSMLICRIKKIKLPKLVNFNYFMFLVISTAVLYCLWVNTFANVRYIMSVFGVSGVVIIQGWDYVYAITKRSLREFTLLIVFLTLCLVFNTEYPGFADKLKVPQLGYKFLYIQDAEIPDNATVFVRCGHAVATVSQNPKARYMYVDNPRFFQRGQMLSDSYIKKIRESIDYDNVYFLYTNRGMSKSGEYNIERSLNQFIPMDKMDFRNNCKVIETNLGHDYNLCKFENK